MYARSEVRDEVLVVFFLKHDLFAARPAPASRRHGYCQEKIWLHGSHFHFTREKNETSVQIKPYLNRTVMIAQVISTSYT